MAGPEQFAHQARIIVINFDNTTEICAGSILAHRWFLTTASCVHLGVIFNVRLGSIYFNKWDQQLWTRKCHIHEKFKGNNIEYNIALLQSFQDIQFNPKVLPVHLPKVPTNEIISNAKCNLVSGFGGNGKLLIQCISSEIII